MTDSTTGMLTASCKWCPNRGIRKQEGGSWYHADSQLARCRPGTIDARMADPEPGSVKLVSG